MDADRIATIRHTGGGHPQLVIGELLDVLETAQAELRRVGLTEVGHWYKRAVGAEAERDAAQAENTRLATAWDHETETHQQDLALYDQAVIEVDRLTNQITDLTAALDDVCAKALRYNAKPSKAGIATNWWNSVSAARTLLIRYDTAARFSPNEETAEKKE